MTDEAAFLRAIQANPTDATAKLVYADWLDEHGEPERAAYLRLLANGAKSGSNLSLETSVGRTWWNWIHGSGPYWDAATLYALGRLDAFIDAYLAFNERTSDISTYFYASLVPFSRSVEELCREHCLHSPPGTISLEAMGDWVAELTSVFQQWLFIHRETHRAHSQYQIDTESGRAKVVAEAVDCVRDVIRPRRGWRVQSLTNHYIALNWADVALEAADRVLLLHFSFSD